MPPFHSNRTIFMTPMIPFDLLILLVSVCTNTALGVVVLRSRKDSVSTRLFLAMIGLIVLWSFANYFVDMSATPAQALIWTRILYSLALAYIWIFFLFARSFSTVPPMRIPGLVSGITFLTTCGIIATLGTDLVFQEASIGMHGLSGLLFGPWYDPINAASLAVVGIAIGELLRKGRIADNKLLRAQANLISLGWLIFLGLVIICGAVLPELIPSMVNGSKVAPLFSIIMVACTTYSIIRHRFLDIRLIVRRGLVYSLMLGVVLGIYLAILLTFAFLFEVTSDTAEFLSGAITALIGIATAPHIERYFRRQTDRIFFKEVYEYASVVEELGSILNSTLHVPALVTGSLQVLSRTLKPERIEFIHLPSSTRYEAAGPVRKSDSDLPPEEGLIVPIYSEGVCISQILLWPKRSGDPYTTEDASLLRTFASQASTALEKASLYDRLEQHALLLEEKVLERTKHLEDLRAGQRDFMDEISHALQTPLTVLTSAIEGIPDTVPVGTFKYRELAAQSIDELTRLIRNLLALARVDALPEEDAAAEFDLSDMLTRLVEYVSVVCEQNGIQVTGDITPGISLVGNQKQIEEAVTNILSNAVRYTKDAEIREIRVRLISDEDGILLSIEDTGTGIDPERLPHIFERFYRAQDREGSGLGLAITKRIIERHGGSITVTSTLGTGTAFELRLPR